MAFLPGVVEGASSLAAAGLNYFGQREANRANRKIAREQMQFQERMSNTAYQRARADMEAAGFNPMLMYQQGGASSPAGASAQIQSETAGVSSSALAVKRTAAELDNLRAQNENLRTQNSKMNAEIGLTKALEKAAEADKALKMASAVGVQADNVKKQFNAEVNKTSGGGAMLMLERILDTINPFKFFK